MNGKEVLKCMISLWTRIVLSRDAILPVNEPQAELQLQVVETATLGDAKPINAKPTIRESLLVLSSSSLLGT